ncbi:hypothetical protein [Cellulomonas chengniuliangii]|uniref:hypothetical protein n=1 Tax=Cellulomonas chengniuliangii TaxID=2968084 RepID=UPI001D0F258B|nr:hypothetical protein [Cellulomonas chengniuliangii]MCC2317689.1 hypothetical protein [Cellulomonas chengniuliangii]
MTALLLVHGRGQQMPRGMGRAPEDVERHVDGLTRRWLGGLAKGSVLAGEGLPPIDSAYFPFYGNDLAARVAELDAAGGPPPDLAGGEDVTVLSQHMLIDAAEGAGYRAEERLPRTGADGIAAVAEMEEVRRTEQLVHPEVEWSDFLRLQVARSALQFLASKTTLAEWVIEQFYREVAYYLADAGIRTLVQGVVLRSVEAAVRDGHTDLVVVGHSLGSVVAYDVCHSLPAGLAVRLFATTGSPLGLRVVRRRLAGPGEGSERRPVPGVIHPWEPMAPAWVNAYDVRDVVALVHPLAPLFTGGDAAIRDERTDNPSSPHSVEDYLADPDVAGPLVRALTGADRRP